MREKFHQKLVTLHKRRKRIEDRNRDPARKFPTIVQTNLIFPFFERFQGCYFSPPLPHFVSVCGVREKGKEVSRTSVYYHLRMPSSPNTFSTAIFPYFFLPVAMFVFAIANIKTARARHSTISLSSRRGNAPISYSRDIIPHRCRDSYENRGGSDIFRGNGGTLIDSKLAGSPLFTATIASLFRALGNCWIRARDLRFM